MPQARAAASFEPRAKTRRPNTVRRRTKAMTTREGERHPHPGGEDHPRRGREGHREVVDPGGGDVDGRLAGQPLGRPARDTEHAEGGDERHDAQARDGERVHEADETAGEDGERATARAGAQPSRTREGADDAR